MLRTDIERAGNVDIALQRTKSLALRVAAVACWLLLAAGCSRTPPETALRETLAAMEAAIDARDAAALARHLDDDFIGPAGMDRDAARRTAALYFLQHASVSVVPGPWSIELDDTHARVSFTAAVAGGSGRFVPEQGRVYNVQSGWRLRGADWRMTSIDWTPVLR